MATEQKTPELKIEESQDGSAIVELDESLLKNDDDGDNSSQLEKFDQNIDQKQADDEDADHPDDTDELRDAKRSRRRAKRDLVKKTNYEKDLRLQQLQRENEEFKRRLSDVENRTRQTDVLRIDKNIEDTQVRLEYAKMKMAEAVSSNDGQAMVEAQDLLDEAKANLAQLAQIKKQVAQAPRPEINNIKLPEPEVQRNAAQWINKNSWYKIDGTDRDSRITLKASEMLVEEGWDPKDPDYWDELDSRLQKSLPHRYNDSADSNSTVRKPRNVVGSSGREASAAYGGTNRTQFLLTPERVKAMKEAGAWDNPVRKAKMIENFVKFDRQNKTY